MKNKKLITYKNDIIRKTSIEVINIDNEIIEIHQNMNYVINKYEGVGLAAIQIGIPKRIITIDITKKIDDPIIKPVKITLVNPVILSRSERQESGLEGCLSVPGKQGEIIRNFWIEIEGYTLDGKYYRKKFYDLAARVAQHEIDHLNGILFIDKLEKDQVK